MNSNCLMGKTLTKHEHLGAGASGTVFRATWKSKEHGKLEVAAKKVYLDSNSTTEHLRCEIDCLKKLDHPNLIKYYGAIYKPNCVIILTEYASKGSLDYYLRDKTCLAPHLVATWIRHLALGIQYIKHQGLVHRDIKSPNCLISVDDVLKICDFGIAKPLHSTMATKTSKGSVRWLAPEIIHDHILSPKADIYAFAIVVWELQMCQLPYEGLRSEHILFSVCTKNRRPEIPAHCPKPIKDLMERCWDADKDKRPDIDTVVSHIQNHGEELGLNWQLHSQIETTDSPTKVCWIKSNQIAICAESLVKVYQITPSEGARLQYTLAGSDWRAGRPHDVAVSATLPDRVLVLCTHRRFVYAFPCRQSSEETTKYQILNGKVSLWCMAANDRKVVIGLCDQMAVVVCNLPDFKDQQIFELGFYPFDLSITINDYLVVMRLEEMIIKSLDEVQEDLHRISPPNGWEFKSVSCRNNSQQIYAACNNSQELRGVFKYTQEDQASHYVNTGLIVDKLDYVPFKGLDVTPEGLLAIVDKKNVKIYIL